MVDMQVSLSLPPPELLKQEQGDSAQLNGLAQNISLLQLVSQKLSESTSSLSRSNPLLNRKIQEFVGSVRDISTSSEHHILKHQKSIRERLEREELLTNRRHGEFELNMEDQYEREMEMRDKTRDSMKNSHNLADTVLESSYAVLERLQGQRELVQRIRGQITDIGSAIGISDQLIRTIDRRLTQDKWIVYGGMFGVLVLLVILYYIFSD